MYGAGARRVVAAEAARFGHDAGVGGALGAGGGVYLVPLVGTATVARRRLRAPQRARKRVREPSNVPAAGSHSGHVAIVELDHRPVALQVVDNYFQVVHNYLQYTVEHDRHRNV